MSQLWFWLGAFTAAASQAAVLAPDIEAVYCNPHRLCALTLSYLPLDHGWLYHTGQGA